MDEAYNYIINKIENNDQTQAILFTWKNITDLNLQILDFIKKLQNNYNINKNDFYYINDDGTNIKIEQTREMIAKSSLKSSNQIQIFFIENISRFTTQAFNSCLKFFEEPWIGNIILLSNVWEIWVIDTILSRVKIIQVQTLNSKDSDIFYLDLIQWYIDNNSPEIFSHFYNQKLEKINYITFLKTLLNYSLKNWLLTDKLERINKDINLIENNNVMWKYIVDKYLLELK